MVIQKIRNVTQNKRWLLITVVVVLIIGLLGSYVIWSTGDFGNNNQGTDYKQQIAAYVEYIADTEKDLAEKPEDFSLLQQLGDLNAQLGNVYVNDGQTENSSAAFLKAAEYYEKSLSFLPEGLNEKGQTDIYADIALAYWLATGHDEQSEENFKKGIEISPYDFPINNNYIVYLYSTKGIDSAIAQAEAYRDSLPEGNEYIGDADTLVKNLQEIKTELQKAQEEQNKEDENKDDKQNGGEQKPEDNDSGATK